ncbi:MAG TPA: SusC/RagA family TonB-linked outer membrane protein [Bacteroidales bacterium]|nr:SusC/RagA family TonB-linked outer membrane protein [Bacteroidales bacterium]
MKKLTLMIAVFVLSGMALLWAQAVVITGTVTSSVEGEGSIPGVAIVVKGTTIGTTTHADGTYSITVPTGAATLIFQFIGMVPVEEPIDGRSTIDIVMQPDVLGIQEVIVTGLGITREKKGLGYAVQDISGDEITKAREPNIVNSLQGKAAGVQISGGDGGVASGSRIILRGMSTLTGDNQPLFVVDGIPISNSYSNIGSYGGLDYGNAAMDINPSDVESLSVLKGANAAALYGSRAINGVILITTKTGRERAGRQGLGVTLETNWMWDNVLVLPKYQNVYGQGGEGEFEYVDGSYGGTNDGVDESWGPQMDIGLMIPQFDSPYDPETGVRTPTPWISHPDNVKDYFDTGLKRTTSLALQGATDNSNFRLSISNQDIKGIIHNSDLRKNSVSLNAGLDVTDRLRVAGSANYISNKSDNIVEGGYSGGNPMQSLGQWFGRQVNIQSLYDLKDEIDPITGYPMNWNHSYHDNPYWSMEHNTNSRNRDRLIGNFTVELDITNWLSFKALAGADMYTEDRMERSDHGTNGDRLGGFSASSSRRREVNANAMFQVNKDITPDINLLANIGAEYNHYDSQNHSTGVADLIIPGLFSVSNSAVAATTGLSESHSELQSVFGTFNLSFRNYLFLDATARNDWSSTLPIDNNSYFYPSVSLTSVITEAFNIQSNILSYAKVRGSYAQVGGTAGRYQLTGTYSADNPFNGNPSLGYTNTIPALGLKPQKKNSMEFGGELKFFNNRIGFDVTWYKENTINQILNIAIARTTGFSSKTINAGNLQNMGLEIQMNLTPVRTGDFSWDINANWATNENKVIELYVDESGVEQMNYLNLYAASWSAYVHARPGEEYGILWGYALVKEKATPVYYDDAETQLSHVIYEGRRLVNPATGYFIRSNSRTNLGNVYPDWFGGVNNVLSYKDLTLSFLVDFRKGGVIYSITDWFGVQAGVLEQTAAINDKGHNVREPVLDGGGVLVKGVYGRVASDGTIEFLDALGNVVTTPVESTTYTAAQDYFKDYWGKNELSTFDASFVKLREVSLGYDFRNIAALQKVGIRGMNLALVGRNLWIIHKNTPDIDPETGMGAGNSVGMETNAIPTTRTIGFNLRVNF